MLLTVFLELLKNFKELTKARKVGNRALFVDHVDAIYKDMRSVFEDYCDILQKLEADLANKDVALSKITDELKNLRKEHATTRQELVIYCDALRSKKFPADGFDSFCFHCKNIIESSPDSVEIHGPGTQITEIIEELEWWSTYHNEDSRKFLRFSASDEAEQTETGFRNSIASDVKWRLKKMNEEWHKVMECYHELRVSHLKGV